MILAASTERSIGLVVAVIVAGAFAAYVLANVLRSGKAEIGSEIELAPNRKPYFDDDELETKKLDLALFAGVATLAVIALALPLYWLGEPGRQEGFANFTDNQFAFRGGNLYEEQCSRCHGPEGVGGVADYSLADDTGLFIAPTDGWIAPALNNIFSRFDEDEVLWILNYGRPQSPMPAWGLPGGGPLTEQQLETLIEYLKSIQLSPDEMAAEVTTGLRQAVAERARAEDPAIEEAAVAVEEVLADPDAEAADAEAARDALNALLDDFIANLPSEERGELLFSNSIGAGSYSCARCHTAGNSFGAAGILADHPELEGLITPEVPGGGGYGPALNNGATVRQFDSAAAQETFISAGCAEGQRYGNNGVCDGGGQMPGFADMLTPEQIADIVAYERGL